MRDAGYITAGYVVTAATVAAYAWSIRSRMRRASRLLTGPADSPTTGEAAVAARNREG